MDILTIILLGKPRGKQRPRVLRSGIAYTPKETVNYETALRLEAAAAMLKRRQKPYQGPLRVTLNAFLPIAASWSKKKQAAARANLIRPTCKPDADNILKMLDGLNGIVWRDDAQIVEWSGSKQYSDQPRLVVSIWELRNV